MRITVVALGFALVIGAYIIRQNVETSSDRERIAQKLQYLSKAHRDDPEGDRFLKDIITILNSRWSFARVYACTELQALGPLAKLAIPDLIRALGCGNPFVEREAARALGTVSVGMDDAVEPLRRKLYAKGSDAAIFAAEALGNIGSPAIRTIPDLEKAAKSSDPSIAYRSQKSLKRLRALEEASAVD